MVNHNTHIICILLLTIAINCYKNINYDQTSTRSNTLFDDADDIQRQLDNEARDRLKYGKLPAFWVLHIPTTNHPLQHIVLKLRRINRKHKSKKKKTSKQMYTILLQKEWSYSNQDNWKKQYSQCGGRFQSPINLPTNGLVNVKGCRNLSFINYDVTPRSLTLHNSGRRYTLYGEWNTMEKPVIYGGAAFSRRYVFHSLTLHWPSEHKIGGMLYPFETQALHISAEYGNLQEAIDASLHDRQSMLGIVNLYEFEDETQCAVLDILKSLSKFGTNVSVPTKPLSYFNPPMRQYVCYQGSLPVPPCTEAVLWFVRAQTLPISRDTFKFANGLLDEETLKNVRARQTNPLNDRKVYFINDQNI